MNIKSIISLNVLIIVTASCWGAAENQPTSDSLTSLTQEIKNALKHGDTTAIANTLSDMPAEIIEKIANNLDSSSYMALVEAHPPSYQVLKTSFPFLTIKEIIEKNNGNLEAALFDTIKMHFPWPVTYLLRRLKNNKGYAQIGNKALINAISYHCHAYDIPDAQIIYAILTSGVNPNMPDESGDKLLRLALRLNCPLEIVQMLLDHGADVNTKVADADTALAWAARNNRPELIDLLIAAGANVTEARISFRINPDPQAAQLLNQHSENSPLIKYDTDALLTAVELIQPNKVAALLKNDVNPNVPDGSGITPLSRAIFSFNTSGEMAKRARLMEIIKMLIMHGADINAVDPDGFTALASAARGNEPQLIDLLIAAGGDVGKALTILARYESAKYFLEQRSANVSISDK